MHHCTTYILYHFFVVSCVYGTHTEVWVHSGLCRVNRGGISGANWGGELSAFSSIDDLNAPLAPRQGPFSRKHSWGLAALSPAIEAQLETPLCGLSSSPLLPNPALIVRGSQPCAALWVLTGMNIALGRLKYTNVCSVCLHEISYLIRTDTTDVVWW